MPYPDNAAVAPELAGNPCGRSDSRACAVYDSGAGSAVENPQKPAVRRAGVDRDKSRLVFTRVPDEVAAIKRDARGDPIGWAHDDGTAWAYDWSLEAYRQRVARIGEN